MDEKANLPFVLASTLPSLGLVLHDCDCACALDLPSVLAAGSAFALHDCDCACAVDAPFASAARSTPARWMKRSEAWPIPLAGGWQAYFNPLGPVGVTALNAQARQVLAAFEPPIPLRAAATRVPELPPRAVARAARSLAGVGLLHPVVEPAVPPARTATLSAWLHITESCNLDCPYCYVDKRRTAMSVEVGRRAVDRLIEMAVRHGYAALKLKYAGGEPTLHFPLVRAVHAHATRRVAETGLVLQEVLLTNGVGVTAAMLNFVAQAGMQLMVSLDGGPTAHDRIRASRDGRSTHSVVTDTVEQALARGVRSTISITLAAPTLAGAGEAVAFALARALPFSLNFYRDCRLAEWEPSPLVPDPDQLVGALLRIFDQIRTVSTYPLPLTGILDRTRLDLPHRHACSAGRDYLVVSTRGQVSACQMLLAEPWADLADEDPLAAVRHRGESVFGAPAGDSACDHCHWRAACGGGCPLVRTTPLHDHYCQVYRILLPELVRLEAGRLIALHSAGVAH